MLEKNFSKINKPQFVKKFDFGRYMFHPISYIDRNQNFLQIEVYLFSKIFFRAHQWRSAYVKIIFKRNEIRLCATFSLRGAKITAVLIFIFKNILANSVFGGFFKYVYAIVDHLKPYHWVHKKRQYLQKSRKYNTFKFFSEKKLYSVLKIYD